MGISLKEMQSKCSDAIREGQNIAKSVYNNTIDDISRIIGGVEHCANEIDKIRLHVTHRAIEYHTLYRRTLSETSIIPDKLIEEVWNKIFGEVEGEANPRIFHLKNPKQAVWGDSSIPYCRSQNPDENWDPRNPCIPQMEEINVSTIQLPENRIPFLFVHGAGLRGNKESAYRFYYYFEQVARMFNNSIWDYSNIDIYLVSYDSLITNNTKLIVREAFESILGPLDDDDAPLIIGAALWKEWEKRAETTANEVVLPFLKRISQDVSESNSRGATVISHSLGCYLQAYASQKFVLEIPEANKRPFQYWFCMAAALPANAFTSTGEFPLAPRIAYHGTSVWFSNTDWILGTLYACLANGYFGMGETGALVSANELENIDVTMCTGLEHDYPAYFHAIRVDLRLRLGTDIWSEQPNCALALSTILSDNTHSKTRIGVSYQTF
ncbi:MAG: hypothetical protein ACYDG2_13235 [Ruminiclostridium sp.]